MLSEDFKNHSIVFFTPEEITGTGADLSQVKLETILRLQTYRSLLGRSVKICLNGLTSGTHKSPYHPGGLAVDSYLDPSDGVVKVLDVFKASLEAGFRGIGIYWNGTAYSFHFDLRPKYAFWCGRKNGNNQWDYFKLIQDPREYKSS